MKIALITDDGKTISQHFGRANHYAVLTIEDGQIVQREVREKLSHKHFSGEAHEHNASQPHGFDSVSQNRHNQMAAAILDCEALICRGMGAGAYAGMKEQGIRPVVTNEESIDAAALAFAAGTLIDHIEKLH